MAEHWWTRLRRSSLEASRFPILCLTLLCLSIADILLTYLLLKKSPLFYESNPLAMWFFERWDIAGMVIYKFSLIALIVLIGEFVERRRAGYGRFVLIVGCLATAAVVCYSAWLFWGRVEPPHMVDHDVIGP